MASDKKSSSKRKPSRVKTKTRGTAKKKRKSVQSIVGFTRTGRKPKTFKSLFGF